MPSWIDFERDAPALAGKVRARLEAHTHMTLATLRRDGSPRISGTEAQLRDGELWIGSMWQARKALDLQRDPRYALHSGSDDPPGWTGDAKVAGRAEEVVQDDRVKELNGEAAANGPSHLFRLDIEEASVVELAPSGKELVITVWTPRDGAREIRRA
ncbi:MAG: pyridoxamine 5'-phosphate oxidase family protein [Solirubrobacterales bacterium]|nr:pyridoxamine 5'-phosphate oxidase family protein [Solirubrobacterales bacterium]